MMTDLNPLKWFFLAASEPLFTIKDAARLTTVAVPTLQNWAARAILAPLISRPGRHGKRMYSTSNLVIIRLAVKLIDLGFGAADAVKIAAQIWVDILLYLGIPERLF